MINNFDKFALSSDYPIPPEEQSPVYIKPSYEEDIKYKQYFRFDSFHPVDGWDRLTEYIIPNSNIYERISSVNNFDPLVTERYDQWSKIVFPEITIQESGFNKFWGIGYVIDESTHMPRVITPLKDEQSRFRWFSCAVPAIDVQDSTQIFKQQIINGMIQKEITVEGISQDGSVCEQQVANMKVDVIQSSPSYTRADIYTEKPGWLMQLATNYPGWKARIDGKVVPLHYGDILFRTIYLPAGEHSVEFLYRPVSFYIGLIISSGFLSILIIFILIRRKFQEHYG
jgi:hypothetical protein